MSGCVNRRRLVEPSAGRAFRRRGAGRPRLGREAGREATLRGMDRVAQTTSRSRAATLLVASTAGGAGSAVLVEGPAGIGKTALLEASRRLAAEHDVHVLAARGSELESGFGGGLARQLFEPVVARAAPEGREALVSGAAELAGRLVGAVPGEADALRRLPRNEQPPRRIRLRFPAGSAFCAALSV